MRLRIEIELDNAAFGETNAERIEEIARILNAWTALARRAPSLLSEVGVRLMDVNGNRVGSAYLERRM